MKEFNKYILENCVTLYLYSDKFLKRTFASYSVKYGSNGLFNDFYYKNEKRHVPFGMAHFLEHTLIEKSKYGNMLHNFANEGYIANGSTYDELTSFYFFGISNVMESIEKLIRMIDDPVFTKEDIEEVKPAVVEELNSRFDDKFSLVNASNLRNLFSEVETAPACKNILGTAARTKAFTYEEVKLAYDAYYNDENKILVIAGNFNEKKMLNYIKGIYRSIPRHINDLRMIERKSILDVRKKEEIIPFHIKGPELGLRSYKLKNDLNIDNHKLSLYIMIYNYLKFNSGTNLYEDLISNKGLIELDYMVDFVENIDGIFFIRYMVEAKNNKEIFKEIEKAFNTKGLSKEEFELRKKFLMVQNIRKRDYIYNMFSNFTYKLFFTDKLSDVDLIISLDYDEMIKIINSLKFNVYSTSIIKYKTD